MSEFVNTRDLIGDQETVDKLVEHSLTDLKEDSVYVLGTHALRKNNGIKNVELPNVKTVGGCSFFECSALETLKIGGGVIQDGVTFGSSQFNGTYVLKKLIIDRPNVAEFASVESFYNSGIGRRNGAIYVPANLVSAYKSAGVSKYFFVYDIAKVNDAIDFDNTITDSWSTILSNQNYASDYEIGDTKTMTMSNGDSVVMQIIAFDTDDKADGTGKAKITWLCKYIYGHHAMYLSDSTTCGWASTTMRSWLHDDVLPMIPNEIRSKIVEVSKMYFNDHSYGSSTPSTSADKIWIPSAYEVGIHTLYSGRQVIRESGVSYANFFRPAPGYSETVSADPTRCKYEPSAGTSSKQWMLRSIYDPWCYCYVSPKGMNDYGGAVQSTAGTVFGFCTD